MQLTIKTNFIFLPLACEASSINLNLHHLSVFLHSPAPRLHYGAHYKSNQDNQELFMLFVIKKITFINISVHRESCESHGSALEPKRLRLAALLSFCCCSLLANLLVG